MPRPKKAIPMISKHFQIEGPLHDQFEILLYSELEGRVPHGAWSALINQLLRERLEKLKTNTNLLSGATQEVLKNG